MKPKFNNLIPCCTVRKESTGKKKVLPIVGLPADREYELYSHQPKEEDVDFGLIYLISRNMLWAIKRENLKDLD